MNRVTRVASVANVVFGSFKLCYVSGRLGVIGVGFVGEVEQVNPSRCSAALGPRAK
jgi:hypothetical protein